MKKITVFILALLYITTSSGIMINKHYCMGKYIEWSFSHNKEQSCSNCGMNETESKGCCDDEQKFLKIINDQKTNKPFSEISPPFSVLAPIAFDDYKLPMIHFVCIKGTVLRQPPFRNGGVAVYIRNCVFRI